MKADLMGDGVVDIYSSYGCPRHVLLVSPLHKPLLVKLDLLAFFLGLAATLAFGSCFVYTSLSWHIHLISHK